MNYLTDAGRLMTLCAAALLVGCTSLAEKKTPYEPQGQDKFADLTRAATQFDARRTEAQRTPNAVADYLDSGVSLSNVACEIWFTGLARAERDTTLTKDLMNVVGTFILGVAGINGANPTSLGRGALGLAAANTAFEVYRADILLGSIEDIRGKIREDRKVAEDSLMGKTDITYEAAQRRLLEYHHLCSVERIKVLLSTSLAAVKFERPDTTLATPIDKAKATSLVTTLQGQLNNVDALLQDPDVLYQTYLALVVYPTADDADPDVAKNARKNQIVAIYAARYASATPANKEQVLTTLQQVSVLLKLGDRLKADLAAGAAQKQADARSALDSADARLETRLRGLSSDAKVQRSLNLPSDVTPEQFSRELRKSDPEQLKLRLGALPADGRRPVVQDILDEMKKVQDAQTRLKLATASADRTRAFAPLGAVTPKIVPIGQ